MHVDITYRNHFFLTTSIETEFNMPQSYAANTSLIADSKLDDQFEPSDYNWKTLTKAGLVFATATGAFLALKVTGSFSLLSSWLRGSLLEDDLDESDVLVNSDDFLAQKVYSTSINEDTPILLENGTDSMQLTTFEALHLDDSNALNVKPTGLRTWNSDAVLKYMSPLHEDMWGCQVGMILGTIGMTVTKNPLVMGMSALACWPQVGAQSSGSSWLLQEDFDNTTLDT